MQPVQTYTPPEGIKCIPEMCLSDNGDVLLTSYQRFIDILHKEDEDDGFRKIHQLEAQSHVSCNYIYTHKKYVHVVVTSAEVKRWLSLQTLHLHSDSQSCYASKSIRPKENLSDKLKIYEIKIKAVTKKENCHTNKNMSHEKKICHTDTEINISNFKSSCTPHTIFLKYFSPGQNILVMLA